MKKITGKVVSDKMKNTVAVETTYFITHLLYDKRISRTKKFHADNLIGAKLGDVVELLEVKPISKTKNWRVTKILEQNVTT